jgi:dolichol-phosphate mannosyltransferase
MKLSIVIPAHNEAGCIERTLIELAETLRGQSIHYEMIVVNDNSTDATESILASVQQKIPYLRPIRNDGPSGFGLAVRRGLECFTGAAVAVYMADGSDRPEDLVRFFHTMLGKGVDCVFGSRWLPEAKVYDYPWPKLVLNRIANKFIQLLFGLRYNDVTNAFKLYRREVIQGLQPFLSHHFNLTVELPLKAIIRGYSYTILPNDWSNRRAGESKLKIKEMGSRYLFIILYCFLEKWLSRGDYQRQA